MYYTIISCELFQKEQKGCRKGTRGTRWTKKLRYIHPYILKKSKRRYKKLAMTWIDYRNAYYMVPQRWIKKQSKTTKNFRWSHKIYRENHEKLESGTNSKRKKLNWDKIQRGIFQRDELSPLLFVLVMVSLNHIFRKGTNVYKLHKGQ